MTENASIHSIDEMRERQRDRVRADTIRSGGGDGSGGDTPGRLSRLEDDVRRLLEKFDASNAIVSSIDKSVSVAVAKLDAKADGTAVAKIEGRLTHMPTKWFVGVTVFSILFAAASALSGVVVYLEKIRTVLGVR